jgi:hypothetical protein
MLSAWAGSHQRCSFLVQCVFLALFAATAMGQNAISNSPSAQRSDYTSTVDLRAAVDEPGSSGASTEMITPTAPRVVSTIETRRSSETPVRAPGFSERERKTWYALIAADHSAALFDAWSTRQVLATGGRELDPMVRPFAHSPSLYPALQVVPLAMDYLGAKLAHSQSGTLRKMWWIPQVGAATGSFLCGAMNLPNRR